MKPFQQTRFFLLCAAMLCCGMLSAQPQHVFTRYVNLTPPPIAPTSYAMETLPVAPSGQLPGGGYFTVGSFDDNGLSSAVVQLTDDIQFDHVWDWKLTLTPNSTPSFNVFGTAACVVGQNFYAGVTAIINGVAYKYLVRLDANGNQLWTVYLGKGFINKLKFNPISNEVVVLAEEGIYQYLAGVNHLSGDVNWINLNQIYHGNFTPGNFKAGDLEIEPIEGDIIFVGTVTNPTTSDQNIVVGKCDYTGMEFWINDYGYQNVNESGKGLAIGTNSIGPALSLYSYRVLANQGDNNMLLLEVAPDAIGSVISAFEYSNAPSTLRAEDLAFTDANIPQGTIAVGVYTMTGHSNGIFGTTDNQAMVFQVNEMGTPITGNMLHYNTDFGGASDDRFIDVQSDGDAWLFTGNFNPQSPGFNPGVIVMRTDFFGDEPVLSACRQEESVDIQQIQVPYKVRFIRLSSTTQALLDIPSHDIDQFHSMGCSNHLFKRSVEEETALSDGNDFNAFPNPAQRQVTVEFNQPATGQLRLIDLQGRLQLTETLSGQNTLQLELDQLAKGIYLLEWQSGKVSHREKLIVE